MPVVITSPVGGLAPGATYTGPLEAFYLAEGYARAQSNPVSHINERGRLKKDDPTLAQNREGPNTPAGAPQAFKLSGELAAPEVATVTPATGAAAGLNTVTIAGDNLTDVTAVTFGGTPATELKIQNDQNLTVKVPAHAAGAVDVVVTDPDGSATKTNGYTYT